MIDGIVSGKTSQEVDKSVWTLLNAALGYATWYGWPVFPCKADKTPLTEHGCKDATTDIEQIRFWWDRYPFAQIGVACGLPSGLLVVDADTKNGKLGFESLHSLHLPETRISETPTGGQQWFLKHVEGFRNRVEILPGLDIRTEGGYVIVPPSTGRRWLSECEIAPAPESLLALRSIRKKAANGEASTTGAIHDGRRNDTLARLAGKLRRAGLSEKAILAALLEENAARCTPPLNDDEVAKIAASIGRYPEGDPDLPPLSAEDEAEAERQAIREADEKLFSHFSRTFLAEETRTTGLFSHNSLFSRLPKELSRDAYHGLVGEFVDSVLPHTEASPVALLAQLLTVAGMGFGRGIHYQIEGDRHYPNLYVAIVGNTAKARKGTSWGRVRQVGQAGMSDLEGHTIGSLGSGEGLVYAVRDPVFGMVNWKGKKMWEEIDPGVKDKRLLVYDGELSMVLKVAARDGNTLSEQLRNGWDHGNLKNSVKNSPLKATGAHISVIGHITREELLKTLTDTAMANGFGNRFLWFAVERSKSLPYGSIWDAMHPAVIGDALREAIQFSCAKRPVGMDSQARELWGSQYAELTEARLGLSGALTARGDAQVIRLAVVYAGLDRSHTIGERHLKAALEVWRYAEDSVRCIFGSSLGDAVADTILKHLKVRSPLARNDIVDIFGRHVNGQKIESAISIIVKMGMACEEIQPTKGRPKTLLHLCEKSE